MTAVSAKTRVAAVIGDPILHSRSPELHNRWLQAADIDAVFVGFRVGVDEVGRAITGVRALGIRGLSVTMPLKEAVIQHLDEVSEMSFRLRSVNMVVNEDGYLIGDSTDGEGLIRGLHQREGIGFASKRVVVIGTGAAARAVALRISECEPTSLDIVGRRREAEREVCQLCGGAGIADDASIARADIVVNASSAGMSGGGAPDEVPIDAKLLNDAQIVVDIVYSPAITPLMRAAQQVGARVVGGEVMLAGQAAIAFERWWGASLPLLGRDFE
ncbi:MAG: shikimate dehydrogenase family protein [Ferrimicrobium sp.]